jgi:hypothetical protein
MGRAVRLTDACNESSMMRWCGGSGSSGITWADKDDKMEGDDDEDEGLSVIDSVVSGGR